MSAIQLNIPNELDKFLPDIVKRNYGKWKERKFHGPGIIEHISETGERVFTVKAALPPNARVSVDTLEKFADIADKLGVGALRITIAGNVEFITDSLDKALKIKEELEKLGFPVGGWGGALWGINTCTAFLTCQIAVIDAPSIGKALGDALKPYFTGEEKLPAKLRVFISGCPSGCAGGTAIDIAIVGMWGAPPKIREEVLPLCMPPPKALAKIPESQVFLVQVCPTGALTLRREGEKIKLVLVGEKCINCGRCKDNCDAFDYDPKDVGAAILIGGKMANTGVGPRLARVLIPWIPANPPRYEEIVAVVKKVIDVWKTHGKPGERLADFVERIGWAKFVELVGAPKMAAQYLWWPDAARTYLTYRARGEVIFKGFRDAP
ncbi:dissimilatory sulfite reductase beta subunit [Pyrobaculum islandicum DSM 4184]|uniref:Dissimilatory sulfite reductase beta subunit n=2 Tax=Pyrobaculum islandicum TaxID=2277 RepID=A1RQX0_PYRIL|nr:dissimilatory-type sulfite reductase subunit beta [Pyrobaculum islandicum]AAC46136.1 dissimilatory siroheme-sulfite reductase beta subunit [Pyrobaculum islandicum DSM 4184]ABL87352.1 dissimilatory sulfite reductase beta subunit [Pyrobaculum islandicum DSM 4184]